MLIVLRPGPKVFFQYELRFVDRLKSQLLISHLFFPSKKCRPAGKRSKKSSRLLGDVPAFLNCSINFYFNAGAHSARSRRFLVPHGSEVPWHLRMTAAPEPARFVKARCWRRFSENGAVSDLSHQVARMSHRVARMRA